MTPLEIWRGLVAGDDPERWIAALADAARWSWSDRVPLLPLVPRLVEHRSAAVRRAAIDLLSGTTGVVGLRLVVAALDDDDDEVRSAAVEALAASACAQPMRLAHAIFHARSEVRRHAVRCVPPAARVLLAWARADRDPEVAAACRGAPWPSEPMPLVCALWRRGLVDASEAAAVVLAQGAPALRVWATRCDQRSDAMVTAWIRTAWLTRTVVIDGRDGLDDALAILRGAGPLAAAIAGVLHDAVAGEPELRRRALVAACRVGASAGYDEALARFAVRLDPHWLGFESVDVGARRIGAPAAIGELGNAPRLTPAELTSLLARDLVGEPPSLTLLAALVALLPGDRLPAAIAALGRERFTAAVASDRAGWAALCGLPHEPAFDAWLAALPEDETAAVLRVIAALRWSTHAPERVDVALFAGDPARTIAVALPRIAVDDPVLAHRDRLVGVLAGLLDQAAAVRTIVVALAQPDHPLSRAWLGWAVPRFGPAVLATALAPAEVPALVRWLDDALALDGEAATILAAAWRDHDAPVVRAFVERALRASAPPSSPRVPTEDVHRLGRAEADAIAQADERGLEAALAPAMVLPCFGLTDALARRPTPLAPHLPACAALVGCIDGLGPTARELARFGRDDDPELRTALLHAVLALWRGRDAVPPLVDAVLIAFDRNAAGFVTWLQAEDGGWSGVVQRALELAGLARTLLLEATASVLETWAWRRATRSIAAGLDVAVLSSLVDVLDTQIGPAAARILVAVWRSGLEPAAFVRLRGRVVARAPSCTQLTHHHLAAWVALGGIVPRDRLIRRAAFALPPDPRVEIRTSDDLDRLAAMATGASEWAMHEAVVRLLELGEAGELRLVEVLGHGELRFAAAIVDSIALWSSARALAELDARVRGSAWPLPRRWAVACALLGRPGMLALAVALARTPSAERFVAADAWDRLAAVSDDLAALSQALLEADDVVLVDAAVRWRVANLPPASWSDIVLAPRMSAALRRELAPRLQAAGSPWGLPILLSAALDPAASREDARDRFAAIARRPGIAATIVDVALLGGAVAAGELRVVELLDDVLPLERDAAIAHLLVDGSDGTARKRIVAGRSLRGVGRHPRLGELADTFAWGIRRGLELTGRRFSIHMTPKREQWGFTRMGETAIHVTPLPILAGERNGRDVVEGLILHEIGHHVCHASKPAVRIWKRAHKQGLGQLLNLVADEHLERNLRSVDASFGDRIKRLDAHAFQHAARQLDVLQLLGLLGVAAPEVLARVRPRVAHAPAAVIVDSGPLLAELDRIGNSFARFVRALRMGLGNRSEDPIVAQALRHFDAGFRHLDMAGLYRVTKDLAALFGDEAGMAEGFGGHESVEWNERDADIAGEGLADDEVQREVQRILEPPKNPGGRGIAGGSLAINVGPGASYSRITNIRKLAPDAGKHRTLAGPVARHAAHLRHTLIHLGLAQIPARARLRGRSLDRSRIRPMVVRGEPRVLVAREVRPRSDLFLGVLVDCSGSMSGANLDRARRFAVLVAEAARNLPGVDARFFGFTDKVIYDAGDARRCAVTSLEASDGNNDAAALDHVARVAAASHRRAKLLVMVSDGLPTECSVTALRGVVTSLTKRYRMCCAQVAVRPLAEVCFPHYVVLDDAALDAAVRRFGDLVARLVGRVLSE